MKKHIKNLGFLLVAGLLFIACTKDEVNTDFVSGELNSSGTLVEMVDVTATDLVGTWKIDSMISDVEVDLNFDQNSSTNILAETDCFNNMYFTFDGNGTVTTGQAKLDFGENGELFECGYGTYSAHYEIDGGELLITFTLDGVEMTQSKTISIKSNATGEYLYVALEDYEAAQYVDDPGNTVASDIGRVEMVYKKQ